MLVCQLPDTHPQIPKILMRLNQADILTKDIIQQWGTHVSKKYVDRDISKSVRKASEPFLKVSPREYVRSARADD